MRPLRAGILGPGGIAQRHAAAILAIPEAAELVAVCGRDPERTAAFADRFGGAPYAALERMLDEANLDLLIVALPPFAHGDEMRQAARRGIHLLLEKPIALSDDEADRLVAAAHEAGIKTQVGFMYRFGAAVSRWRALQAAGETGPVGLFTGRFHCNSLHAPWWRERAKSGGQMVEQLIHLIDLVRFHMGEPSTVYARAANLFHKDLPRYDSEDVSAIVFGFEGGAIATLNSTNAAIPGLWAKEWQIVAERMTGHFQDWNRATLTWTMGDARDEKIADETNVFSAELLDLVAAIREDRPALTPVTEGAKSLKLALAVRRAADERREIRL
ncbi:MAG: Gfo/Idh/MocA family oxidoreductase [Rhizobiales bacterium]|nr:Gfo/Idh/MocA family oxidoreductase [Hyphomicrobiales bacterium]